MTYSNIQLQTCLTKYIYVLIPEMYIAFLTYCHSRTVNMLIKLINNKSQLRKFIFYDKKLIIKKKTYYLI